MRRRLRKFLPIVLIALMVQILAPIGACWAASIAASDPLAAATICRDGAAATAGQANSPTDQGGGHHMHDGGCCMACGSHAPASIAPVGGGFLQGKPESFPDDFAADLPKSMAHFMAISQVPISTGAFTAKATAAAWSSKPSYGVVAKQDRMINPDLERFMTSRAKSQTIELPGSHAVYASHAREVAALIEKAAKGSE